MMLAKRYLAREIYKNTFWAVWVLLALFTFFSMIEDLDRVNDRFTFLKFLWYQLVQFPVRIYDLLPVSLLIGSIIALANLAQHNELIMYRLAGLSSARFVLWLWRITIPIMLLALVLSEFITPYAEQRTSAMNLEYLNRTTGVRLYSGYWFREVDGEHVVRMINIGRIVNDTKLQNVQVFSYDKDTGQLLFLDTAKTAYFKGNTLYLEKGVRIASPGNLLTQPLDVKAIPENAKRTTFDTFEVPTSLTLSRVLATEMQPERMSTPALLDYLDYLSENHLQSSRYMIALWRKLSYPFALLVMITIAAPIGFIQTRKGGVSAKIFIGILLGVAFFMVNQLALNIGMLSQLSPWVLAILPNLIAMILAILAIVYREMKQTNRSLLSMFKGNAV